MSAEPDSEYGACRAAYDIKKLRGKGIARKIGGSRRYEPLPEGLRAVIAGGAARNGNPAAPRRQHPTRDPLQTIRSAADRSALRKTSEPASQPLYGTWYGRLRIHSIFFIPSDEGQTGARIVSSCEGTATLRHNRILHQRIIIRVLLGSGKAREWKNQQGELLLRLFFLLQCFNGPNRPAELRIFDLLDVF
jgi:hypothetical protein